MQWIMWSEVVTWLPQRQKSTFFEKNFLSPGSATMYDFHNSTDTLKFWTEKQAINKSFYLYDFGETWWNCSTHG